MGCSSGNGGKGANSKIGTTHFRVFEKSAHTLTQEAHGFKGVSVIYLTGELSMLEWVQEKTYISANTLSQKRDSSYALCG